MKYKAIDVETKQDPKTINLGLDVLLNRNNVIFGCLRNKNICLVELSRI